MSTGGRRMADGGLAGERTLDAAVGPPGGELLAVFLEGGGELGEARVEGMLGGRFAELAEEVAAAFFPPDAH